MAGWHRGTCPVPAPRTGHSSAYVQPSHRGNEFKAALNGSWTENYGAGGALNGNNITLSHPGGPVTFRYDNSTHLLSAGYAVTAAGGCRGRGRHELGARLRG